MGLVEIVRRRRLPKPWAEGDNIPWNDPAFSARMLREHLSQAHDLASRRLPIVEQHVRWIHDELLKGQHSCILDLGCGPGLYMVRLAAQGHSVTGIDYSPASIAYAREAIARIGKSANLVEADLRAATFGGPFDLVMLISGEINVFKPNDAADLLNRCAAALAPAGRLLLEISTYDAVRAKSALGISWYTAEEGLWSDKPHIVLQEAHWDAATDTSTTRYYVVDAETANVRRFAVTHQAYRDEAIAEMLRRARFTGVEFLPKLGSGDPEPGMAVVVAQRAIG